MRATPVCLQQYAASNVQRSSAPPKRIGNVNFDVAPASCLLLALPRQNHKKIRKTRVVSRKVLIETPLELTLAVPNPSQSHLLPSSPLCCSTLRRHYKAQVCSASRVACVLFVCVCVEFRSGSMQIFLCISLYFRPARGLFSPSSVATEKVLVESHSWRTAGTLSTPRQLLVIVVVVFVCMPKKDVRKNI